MKSKVIDAAYTDHSSIIIKKIPNQFLLLEKSLIGALGEGILITVNNVTGINTAYFLRHVVL